MTRTTNTVTRTPTTPPMDATGQWSVIQSDSLLQAVHLLLMVLISR